MDKKPIEEKQRQTYPEVGEDATQYGEFISTYFAWIPLPDQKEKAQEMAQMTEREKTCKTEPVPNARNMQNRTGTECTKRAKRNRH